MIVAESNDISIAVTAFFMKFTGYWKAANTFEQRCRNFTLIYTIVAILFAVWIQATDLYYSRDDFGACLYIACNILSLGMALFKILVLLTHKKEFFKLVLYLERKFLNSNYDDHETTIMTAYKRTCNLFIFMLTFATQATLISYVINPVVANLGRNESDRVLPFRMWVDLPLTMTPYFEISFFLQVLSLYQIGLCYFCFDNFLCIMNLHVACQFRILQYRLLTMNDVNEKGKKIENSNKCAFYSGDKYYTTFKNYIQQHQILIAYSNKLEEIFSLIVLGQVLIFSALICLDGIQILVAQANTTRRIIFVFHIMACISQLLMFTYSCDCLVRESADVASAVYSTPWTHLVMSKSGRMMRKDLIFVSMRARVPCCLTGQGFFTVSMETSTAVLKTAMSYFTLLRQNTVEE